MLAHLDELPTLPAVAVKLMELTSDLESSNEEIAELLRGDQSLAAKVLSLANSAAAGGASNISTIEKAVVRLGFNAVRAVVLTAKVFECLGPGVGAPRRGFERAEFWKHALAVACAAKHLAGRSPQLKIDPNEAFIAALLHDIGKVALDAVYPKTYMRIASIAVETHGDIADAERKLLGVDHTIAGRRLAERWRLPKPLQEVIWLHHLAVDALPASVTAPKLIGLVQAADAFAREQRVGFSGNHVFYESSQVLSERVGLTPTAVDDLAPTLMSEVAEWTSALGLDAETTDSIYLRALTRANGELGRLYNELLASNRRLSAGARYFQAISELDRRLTPRSDQTAVVRAIVESSVTACQRLRLGAFAVRDNRATVDVSWSSERHGEARCVTRNVGDELADWLEAPGDSLSAAITQAPRCVRNLFAAALHGLGDGDAWLLPIVHANAVTGGIFYLADTDERDRLSKEAEDLHSYLTSLGLAIGQANAQAAAQRLSDDLAENNRRLQQMQSEVLRSRTLATIAEMAAGAGHELNSPLAVISGRAQMLRKELEDPKTARTLELIVEKAHECSRIVKELMDFARPRPLKPTQLCVGDLLRDIRDHWLAAAQMPASRFALQVEEHLPKVHADPEQLEIALTELLRNAAEATAQNEGNIAVLARRGATDGLIEIIVRDTGYGMSQAVAQRAFDPFYSHRPAGRSRGLGLPRAERIIDAHGGRIWIDSRPGEGADVHVLLPIAEAEPNVRRNLTETPSTADNAGGLAD